MARIQLSLLIVASWVVLSLAGPPLRAGDKDLKKQFDALNVLTGKEPMLGAFQDLIRDKEYAKKVLAFGLPTAKKKEMAYDGAMVLALAAAEMKDMKTSEVYFRVCMNQAAKLQSFERLKQSYGLLIGLYFDYKQYADCVRICKELLELNTDDGKDREVIATMVDAFGRSGFQEPQDRFDAAVQLRPEIFDFYVKATAKQGKFDQAIKLVDNLIKKSDDWFDRELKGWVLKEAGKLDEAADIYEDVIKSVAKDQRYEKKRRDLFVRKYRYEISNIYIELKKIDRASEHLELLIKAYPESPTFYNDLGYIWADNEMKLDEAEKMIRKAIDLDRDQRKKAPDFDPKTDHDNGAYLDSLGWVLFKQKKNKEAKEWLLKAIEDKSSLHIEIFDHLADVQLALGEREAAIQSWQRGLEFVNDSRRDMERKAAVEKKLEKAKDSK